MIKDGPLRRDINRVLDFRVKTKLVGYKPTAIDHRVVYSASLFEVASEHVSSICLLLLHSRTSSAAALLRSCIESAVRATWLLVASDEAVNDVVSGKGKDKGWPGLEQLMGAIEGHHKAGGMLRRIFSQTGSLNDLTHGGLMQIEHRMGPKIGRDTDSILNRLCLRNAANALALVSSAFYLQAGNAEGWISVAVASAELFANFEIADDVA